MWTLEDKLPPLKELLNGLKQAGLRHKNVDYDWIEDCVEEVFRQAPLKQGDRVKLTREPDFEKAPGWQHSKHFLKPGAKGTVKYVEFYNGKYSCYVEFDEESWVRTWGENAPEIVPVEADKRHVYGFRLSKTDPMIEKIA